LDLNKSASTRHSAAWEVGLALANLDTLRHQQMVRIAMVFAVVGSVAFVAATVTGAFKRASYTLASDNQ
jgi:outer membrane PBP1 activator LpoA protein